MESQESRRIAAPLAHRVGKDANAAQIADAIVATWQEIEAALTPIIGRRGVVALYGRSLHLTGSIHPWMAGTHEGVQTDMDLAALKSVFRQQSSANAAGGGNALFQTFYELLASLVGPSLTGRLLLRLFSGDDDGIHIGAMLPDQEGLLGDRPTRKSTSDLRTSAIGADDG